MAEITVRNLNNETLRTIELDAALVEYPLKKHLIFESVLAQQAAARRGTHKTKNRVDVSGGTRKLWKQKHTGRARMGDNRSPLWRHGGTVHGPQPRDYAWKLPKRMRRNALRSALAQRLRDEQVICVESLALDSPKTKALVERIGRGLGVEVKTLLVPAEENRNLTLAARNHPDFTVVRALGLTIVDLLRHDTVVIEEAALKQLGEVLAR